MNIIICDDSKKDIQYLTKLLQEYGNTHNQSFEIKEYHTGQELLDDDNELQKCDIIFLDISMADIDGLQIAKDIRKVYANLPIVLVTAYMNYALEGYKVKASHFLLKDDLDNTIEECMDDLVAEVQSNNHEEEFPFIEGNRKLHVSDIIYIETDSEGKLLSA